MQRSQGIFGRMGVYCWQLLYAEMQIYGALQRKELLWFSKKEKLNLYEDTN